MRSSLRRAAALVPVAALGFATMSVTSPAGAADPPQVNIGNVTISEGDAGGPNTMKFPVTLSEPASGDVTVQWSITPATATPADYTALKKPKVTKIKQGKTTAFAAVKELPDTAVEGDETFSVTIDSVSGPAVAGTQTVGTGTILDDDAPSGTTVSVGDASTVETNAGMPKLALPFTLSSPLPAGEVWVTWTIVPGNADPANDYKPLKQPKVTKIKAGKTSAQATISVYGDSTPEANETFTVQITNVAVGVGTGSATALRTSGTGTIVDDDTVADPTVAPGAPSNVVASHGSGTIVNVTWNAPTTGDAPAGYNFEYTDDGGANWNDLGNGGPVPSSFSIGMSYGTYQFRIQAENSGGQSPWSSPSNEIIVSPPVVNAPGAPSNVVASLTAENFAHADWTAPTTGDAPDQYNYEYSTDGGTTWNNAGGGGPTPTFTLELPAGTYVFHIQGENAGGAGPWSGPSNEITVPEIICNPFCNG